jgi:SAM-dependent methyltransferase
VSRRGIRPEHEARWVFNRLADAYAARPGYPAPLVERLAALAGGPGARVADLGAGTGLLARPLAARGLRVNAVDPARAMLDVLRRDRDRDRDPDPDCDCDPDRVVAILAPAEETTLPSASFDVVVLADALQWIDPERGGHEAARLLAPCGVLAVVTPALDDTPFLSALKARIAAANPKARPLPPPVARLFAAARLAPPASERFHDEELLDDARLDQVLRSLSYVGPALGPAALEALLADALALAAAHGGARWARTLTLEWQRRAGPGADPPRGSERRPGS